ncbi:DUF393 domain-containing protein [Salinigranum rubrum]|uniref:DUF393 domain-containing protein n=1 Tax=Salinigranum rubrum TaxID=755307 RepID=A0A2I8VLY9_9EURY|nr:DCC1-like thiol-disulfide oxidoreductase family protein [Salinigranum rubrum]AUV82099.1 DUF393 domain-containing protein [Salinigranum rubrum]
MTQSQHDAVLVYDGECPYCSLTARTLRRLRGVATVSWYDETAQELLRAQFGETPFAVVLVDRRQGRVYAGRSAAEEVAERAGAPDVVSSLVRDRYDEIAWAVGVASGRDRDPDDYHDVYPLTEDAAALFDDLAGRATSEAATPA